MIFVLRCYKMFRLLCSKVHGPITLIKSAIFENGGQILVFSKYLMNGHLYPKKIIYIKYFLRNSLKKGSAKMYLQSTPAEQSRVETSLLYMVYAKVDTYQ